LPPQPRAGARGNQRWETNAVTAQNGNRAQLRQIAGVRLALTTETDSPVPPPRKLSHALLLLFDIALIGYLVQRWRSAESPHIVEFGPVIALLLLNTALMAWQERGALGGRSEWTQRLARSAVLLIVTPTLGYGVIGLWSCYHGTSTCDVILLIPWWLSMTMPFIVLSVLLFIASRLIAARDYH
jgi:hypothetical protein